MEIPEFNSFNEAEDKIKDQVLELCDSYSEAIKKLLPLLKKASETQSDHASEFKKYYENGNDNLHNLIQLKVELNELTDFSRGIIMEISSEVLSNTVQYLHETPIALSKTSLFN